MKLYYFIILGLVIIALIGIYSLMKFLRIKNSLSKITTKEITKDAIFLSLLCVTGMIAIPLGDNIKVSLQFLTLIIIFGLCDSLFDAILIPTLYLLLGLVVPIYAGFMAGITPTFGFVLAFPFAAIPFWFIYRYIKVNFYVRYILASLSGLLIVYFGGTIFFMFYLSRDIVSSLLITVVPYIGFDCLKIAIALTVTKLLPPSLKPSFINR